MASMEGVSDYLFGLIPNHTVDPVGVARWLVCKNFWGTLCTINNEQGGAPFGHVVSFSDGFPDRGRGIPYFYLTKYDISVRNIEKDAKVAFAVSELGLGPVSGRDPQDPTVTKLTMTGNLEKLDRHSAEGQFALSVLFAKHPGMKKWPANHDFEPYKLEDIKDLFLLFETGGPVHVPVKEYLRYPKKMAE
ncbi:hypothetical protein Scep_010382 [Stephania cephalantha]|uniref:CREG-like beta-barrel domain-containing protein n=1 Tax=Stephania cephalantha TaxID=152367 RepID=A0AAP0JVC2_9MAGN